MDTETWATPGSGSTPARRARRAGRTASGLLLLLLCVFPGCGDAARTGTAVEPRVVTSIFPVADLARRIGGDDVEVQVLLPPGASPATFEPTPSAVRAARGARLLLLVGGGLDPWAADLAPAAGGTRTVRLLEGLKLLDQGEGPGSGNPHLWLDPIRTRDELVPRITRALETVAPQARSRMEKRAGALADSLTALDGEIRSELRPLEHRSFVASHPAWVYFARRYGLHEVGVAYERPGQEPSARELAALVGKARAAGVPVVFSEWQMPDAAAHALADELGVPELPLDPLGGENVPGRNSYGALMRYNTRQLVRGLGGREDSRTGADG